ncbi:predicted GPI-anchored protein 58 [Miscanthus floridulus]|uniref:predicted GPI-anchored protein 58 n=1 Tax=Miscanthus floridulus TaxID=154761 RepID=UPI00345B26E4
MATVEAVEPIFSPSRAAASLLARLPKPAQRASEPARARRPTSRAGLLTPSRAALASAQPRAVPLLAARPRADRGRELPPRGGHVPASPAARQPRSDPAPTRPPSPAGARALAHSRPRCLSSPPEPRASRSAARCAHAPAGAIRRSFLTSTGNHAPATPPRPPSSRAHACAAFRTQVEPPRASPPTAMAPPCSAAMEVVFLLFSSLA